MGIASALALALPHVPALAADVAKPAYAERTAKVVDEHVIPRFERFQKATNKLAIDLDATCSDAPKRLSPLREDFDQAVLAWAEIEFLRIGPLAVTGRPERISFWPDPHGFMRRQLGALIAKRDATALDPATLATKSAAIQGLPALEILLTATPPITAEDDDGRYRCKLAVAIAKNLQGIAGELVTEWGGETGWRARMLSAGPDNPSYKAPAEPQAEFARALLTGLQMIQDRQIAPLMPAAGAASPGDAPPAAPAPVSKKAKPPPQLPYAATGLSARYLAAAIGSLQALYEAQGLGRKVPDDKAWMPRWIAQAWVRLAHDAPAAIEKGAPTQPDPDRERELRMVRFHLEGIRKIVGRELAPLAGLTIGFNELDGD